MKTRQWVIAGVVLAGIVFLLAYAVQYLGRGKQSDSQEDKRQALKLHFPRTKSDRLPYLPLEIRKEGKSSFWFENKSSQPVKLGVLSASCKCSSIDVFPVSTSGQQLLCIAAAAQALVPLTAGALQVFVPPVSYLDDEAADRITRQSKPEHLTRDSDVTVPVNGLGLVQMTFKIEQIGPRIIKMDLWTDQKSATPTSLEASLYALGPMLVEETNMGSLVLKEQSFWGTPPREVYCYSLTRDSLTMKATVEHGGRSPASDPLQVIGPPEKMTVREIDLVFSSRPDNKRPAVCCMYRVPVRLNERAKDGTRFDMGRLRREVRISLVGGDGTDVEYEMAAIITGEVKGDITITPLQDGSIQFDTFQSGTGSKPEAVSVQTDVANLELEVDTERTSKVLQADLEGPVQSPTSSRRSWTLTVQVRPNMVRGRFPDPDVPAYSDSAVYLKTKGPSPQGIRVPVAGTSD
jgi:hypothetical protein